MLDDCVTIDLLVGLNVYTSYLTQTAYIVLTAVSYRIAQIATAAPQTTTNVDFPSTTTSVGFRLTGLYNSPQKNTSLGRVKAINARKIQYKLVLYEYNRQQRRPNSRGLAGNWVTRRQKQGV